MRLCDAVGARLVVAVVEGLSVKEGGVAERDAEGVGGEPDGVRVAVGLAVGDVDAVNDVAEGVPLGLQVDERVCEGNVGLGVEVWVGVVVVFGDGVPEQVRVGDALGLCVLVALYVGEAERVPDGLGDWLVVEVTEVEDVHVRAGLCVAVADCEALDTVRVGLRESVRDRVAEGIAESDGVCVAAEEVLMEGVREAEGDSDGLRVVVQLRVSVGACVRECDAERLQERVEDGCCEAVRVRVGVLVRLADFVRVIVERVAVKDMGDPERLREIEALREAGDGLSVTEAVCVRLAVWELWDVVWEAETVGRPVGVWVLETDTEGDREREGVRVLVGVREAEKVGDTENGEGERLNVEREKVGVGLRVRGGVVDSVWESDGDRSRVAVGDVVGAVALEEQLDDAVGLQLSVPVVVVEPVSEREALAVVDPEAVRLCSRVHVTVLLRLGEVLEERVEEPLFDDVDDRVCDTERARDRVSVRVRERLMNRVPVEVMDAVGTAVNDSDRKGDADWERVGLRRAEGDAEAEAVREALEAEAVTVWVQDGECVVLALRLEAEAVTVPEREAVCVGRGVRLHEAEKLRDTLLDAVPVFGVADSVARADWLSVCEKDAVKEAVKLGEGVPERL